MLFLMIISVFYLSIYKIFPYNKRAGLSSSFSPDTGGRKFCLRQEAPRCLTLRAPAPEAPKSFDKTWGLWENLTIFQ